MNQDRIIAMIIERQSNIRQQLEDCKALLLVLDRAIRAMNNDEYIHEFTKERDTE
jgi:hypothetical protein